MADAAPKNGALQVVSQLNGLWQKQPARRKSLAMLVVIAIGGWVGYTTFLKKGEVWSAVSESSSPDELQDMYGRLESHMIPARLNNGKLEVPGEREMEARGVLAVQAKMTSGGGYDKMLAQSSLGRSQMYENVAFKQAFEGELGRSIASLTPVESAIVKVAFGKKTMMRDMAEPATASAIIRLRPGAQLSPDQTRGVRQMIAASVDGLKSENVTLVDGTGRPLEAAEPTSSDKKSDVEAKIVKNVTSFLENSVGVGKVSVVATADLDTSKVNETSETYDKDKAAVLSRSVVTDGAGAGGAAATPVGTGGPAGAGANLPGTGAPSVQPGVAGAGAGGASGNGHFQETTNYNVSKTIKQMQMPDMRITKLHVAVLVDHKTEAGKPVPRTDKELADLTVLAKQAAGIEASRNDELVLLQTVFMPKPELPAAPEPVVAEPGIPMLYVEAGAGGVVLLFIIVMVMMSKKNKKKAAKELPAAGSLALPVPLAELERMVDSKPMAALGTTLEPAALPPGKPLQERVLEAVKNDVERTAGVLTSWLSEAPAKAQPAKGAKS